MRKLKFSILEEFRSAIDRMPHRTLIGVRYKTSTIVLGPEMAKDMKSLFTPSQVFVVVDQGMPEDGT